MSTFHFKAQNAEVVHHLHSIYHIQCMRAGLTFNHCLKLNRLPLLIDPYEEHFAVAFELLVHEKLEVLFVASPYMFQTA